MILPVRRGGLGRQQRKDPFAWTKKISRKEGESPRLRPPLCASPALRLCVKKNRSRKEEETQRSRPLCGFATLRLCVNKKRRTFKASFPTVDGLSGFARKKNVSQRRGAAKKEIPLRLCFSAPLREPTFYQKINRRYRRVRWVPTKTIPVLPIRHQWPAAWLSK